MAQGREAFATFLPKFERTLTEAGGNEWADQAKVNTLKRTLNMELRRSLVYVPVHPTGYNDFVQMLQTLASRLDALRTRTPTTPAPPTADVMDWEPSTNKAQTSGQPQTAVNKVQAPANGQNEQKRAQWVSKDVLEKRKSNNLCLRCGKRGHFIDSCRLLPARPPQPAQQDQTKTRVTKVEEDDNVTVVEELDSDTELGKE